MVRRPSRSSSENVSNVENQKRKWVPISEVLAAIAVIVTAAPAYWSYECRSTGTFCEGSFVAPMITEAKKDLVLSKLEASGGEQNFDGLSIREAGVWPFGKRYDIVASFKDGTETAIDTFSADQISHILASDKHSVIAVVHAEEKKAEAKITAYFPSFRISKRLFALQSTIDSGNGIKVHNITFDASTKSLTFDVVAPNPWLTINNNKSAEFTLVYSDIERGPFGATVTVELTDDLHVKKAYDAANKVAFIKTQKELADCKNEALTGTSATEGMLVPCLSEQGEDLAFRSRRLLIFEWRGGAFHQVESVFCGDYSCYWKYDSANKTMFVTTDNASRRSRGGAIDKQVDIWLSVIKRPFDYERTLFVGGDCKKFHAFDMAYTDNSTIRFQLTTDCAAVIINNRRFDIRPAEQKGIDVTEVYRLKLDRDGLPIGLAPERALGASR